MAQTKIASRRGAVPIGGVIAHDDFNGLVALEDGWLYCDGSVVSDPESVLNGQTLQDLSGRYIVGFGTDGGGDVGTAPWATAPVGNAGHLVSLLHNHPIANDNTNTATANAGITVSAAGTGITGLATHTHGAGSGMAALIYGADSTWTEYASKAWTTWTPNKRIDTSTGSNAIVNQTRATEVVGTTAAPSTAMTDPGHNHGTTQTPHAHALNNHNHGAATGNSLSATQSIQPRSIRMRWAIRVK